MYEQSNDEKVKEMARRRLLQLRSFEERDGLRRLMRATSLRPADVRSRGRSCHPPRLEDTS